MWRPVNKLAAVLLGGLLGALLCAQDQTVLQIEEGIGLRQEASAKAWQELLGDVEEMEVMTLVPSREELPKGMGHENSETKLDGWPIVLRMKTDRASEIAMLREGMRQSILQSDGSVAMCFLPRHGIRFSKHHRMVTVAVCFQCLNMEISGAKEIIGATINNHGARAFYSVFRAHGLLPGNKMPGETDGQLAESLVGIWVPPDGHINDTDVPLRTRHHTEYRLQQNGRLMGEEKTYIVSVDNKESLWQSKTLTGSWRVEDSFLLFDYQRKDTHTGFIKHMIHDYQIIEPKDTELILIRAVAISGEAEAWVRRKSDSK